MAGGKVVRTGPFFRILEETRVRGLCDAVPQGRHSVAQSLNCGVL